MLIRERATVIQLYRSAYDRQTQRSRTQTIGSFARAGQPAEELLARLTEKERAALDAYLVRRDAAHQAAEMPRLLAEVPDALRRIAAWMRNQPKTADVKEAAKALRDAYGELYGVMCRLGMSRLRETTTAAKPASAKPARERRRPGQAPGAPADEAPVAQTGSDEGSASSNA